MDNLGWGMRFGWSFMVLFWMMVGIGMVYIITLVAGRNKKSGGHETALDILKKRYASGEITSEEYEKIKEDLTKS